jgi:uncharacterized membrane protein YwzB
MKITILSEIAVNTLIFQGNSSQEKVFLVVVAIIISVSITALNNSQG